MSCHNEGNEEEAASAMALLKQQISDERGRLTLTTHKIGGLPRNDFIVAAKINRLPAGAPVSGAMR